MKIHNLPLEVVRDRLLGFLDEDYLFPMRMVSKIFSEWIWYYLVEKKSNYSIHRSVNNNRLAIIVDNYLIKLKNLKSIDVFSFGGEFNLIYLTDLGLHDIGRLSTVEELNLTSTWNCYGSFMANWILNSSQLLHSLKVMKLKNAKCEYFHLFKEFNNLKTLELVSLDYISPDEMDETLIELPTNLETLSINYPITSKNLHDIVRSSPSLKEFSLNAENLNDEDLSFVLSSYSQTIQKFEIQNGEESLNLVTGSYLAVFSTNSFPNLRKIRMFWPFTNIPQVKILQRNLFIPSLEKLRVFFNEPDEQDCEIDSLLTFTLRQTNVRSLHWDFKGFANLNLKQERLVENLNNLTLNSLSIRGIFNTDSYSYIMKTLTSISSLEKVKWNNKELNKHNQFVILKDSMKHLRVLKLSSLSNVEIATKTIQQVKSCNLEKVSGPVSCIEYLAPSLKELKITVSNSTRHHLKNLKQLVNLKSLTIKILKYSESIEDFNDLTLPNSLVEIKFTSKEGERLTGLESGLLEALCASENIRQLSFDSCSVEDQFLKGLVDCFKDKLEILKILNNEDKALTAESTKYLSQFTKCRTLLIDTFDASILSSSYSDFEHENPRITNILRDSYPDSTRFYPGLDYEDIEQVISYVKERIIAREMKDASLTIERLFHHLGEKILDLSENVSDIFKYFLVTFPHAQLDWKLPDIDNAFEKMGKLWKSKSISFENTKILNKAIIESQQNFCIVANILLDLDDLTFLTNFDNFLENHQIYEECLKELTKRLLSEFICGNKNVSQYSRELFVNIINSFAENCPEFVFMSEFIDFIVNQNDFKTSRKVLENITKKRSVFINNDEEEVSFPLPNQKDFRQFNTEELLEYAKTTTQKDHSLHLVSVKVPKAGPFETPYFSKAFIEFGYEWIVEFLPVDNDQGDGKCSIFLSLKSTIKHDDEKAQFDRIRLDFTIRNFEVESGLYGMFNNEKFEMNASHGLVVEKEFVEPFSTDDEDFLIFKFFISMKQIIDIPIPSIPEKEIQSFHKGKKELSSTNYPPLIYRMASKYPISIHTLVFRVKPENIGKKCYCDRFEAFGIQFSPNFVPHADSKTLKTLREQSIIGLSLCSFDYHDKPNGIDSVTIKAVFTNSEFDSESMNITKETMLSTEPFMLRVDRCHYQPKEIDRDGEIFYEFTVNCCLALISVSTNYPHLPNDELPEMESSDEESS